MQRAVWFVLAGILSVQFGAAIAKDLFGRIDPTAMVFLRLLTSTVVLVAIARPMLRGRSRQDWLVALGFGLSLGTMNWAIYQSFARIPLGIAVTIEFVGPLAIALVGSRRVVRTLPGWRGAVSRSTALAPGLAMHGTGLFAAVGRRALARRSG